MIKAMSATAMPEMREGLFYSVANFDKNLLAKLAVYIFTLWQISKRLDSNYFLVRVDDTVLLIKRALIHGLEQNVNRLGRSFIMIMFNVQVKEMETFWE